MPVHTSTVVHAIANIYHENRGRRRQHGHQGDKFSDPHGRLISDIASLVA